MSDPRDNLSPAQRLRAYADGELNADGQLAVLQRLSTDPSAVKVVENEIRLRQTANRVLSAEPGPSDELMRKVSALAFQMPSSPAVVPTATPGFRWRLPIGLAAAVGLIAAGLLVGRFVLNQSSDPRWALPVNANDPTAGIVPVSYLKTARDVHVGCSKREVHHPHEAWPASLASIEQPFKDYLGGQEYPNLESIGYKYLGCGPCGRPGQQGVHLLYRNANNDTVSLFVEPYSDQVKLQAGDCFSCISTDPAHPIIAWRTDKLVFFLVCNGQASRDKVVTAMNLTKQF